MPKAEQKVAAPHEDPIQAGAKLESENEKASAGAESGGKAGGEQTQAGPEAKQQQPKKQQFQILADSGAYFAGIPATLEVGHAWIRVVDDNGARSWGLWPVGKFPIDAAFKSVPGEVKSPDDSHSPTAMHTYEVEQAQAEKVVAAAEEQRKSPPDYNLFTHNCVHFCAEMAAQAGVSPPSFKGLLGIANPASLASGIAQLNKKEGENALGQPIAPPGGAKPPSDQPA